MKQVMIQAHRGASAYAPENTLPAFQMAVDMGADGIECDIHLTKDGHYLVCHDHTIDRTSTGTGEIASMELSEIKSYDFGVKFSEEYKGTTAPTLEEMLEVVKPMRVINIEIKRFEHPMGQEKATELFYGILKEFDVLGNTIVSSFDKNALSILKKMYPDVYTCLLYDRLEDASRKAQAIGCTAIHPYYAYLSKATVQAAHRRNMNVNCWTVNDEDEICYMIRMGCDGIITNYPDRGLKARLEESK
ncbi:MAG: glycerophosphodiester phosphodiesterase [Clostridia bacterium]|nr:glycerophosphodiester phosphodiesterase [Clostridia bacterium]